MRNGFQKTTLVIACFALSQSSGLAGQKSVAEFDDKEADSLNWRVVDDGVMGGLSKGKIEISKDGILTFSGKLSLENNGGFSSLRTGDLKMDLAGAEGLVARVKGDGRTYQMRFSTDARFRGMEVSFKADFKQRRGNGLKSRFPMNNSREALGG